MSTMRVFRAVEGNEVMVETFFNAHGEVIDVVVATRPYRDAAWSPRMVDVTYAPQPDPRRKREDFSDGIPAP